VITLISTKTLAKLREEAAQLPRLRHQAAEALREAETSAAEAARLAGQLDAAIAEAGGRLGRLLTAAHDPVTGPSVQADLALRVVRDIIATANASDDPAAVDGIRIMDALLGEDLPVSDTRPAASLSTGQLRDGANHQHAGAHR
jgi:hypothetical protein